MGWKNLPHWSRGLIIGIILTLVLSLINHSIFMIAWPNSPLGLLNLAFCGMNQCSIPIIILNWIIFPLIFLIIWTIIGKIKSKK